MSKVYLPFLILFFCILRLNAQEIKIYQFHIQGGINTDSGDMKIHLLADSSFYPKEFTSIITPVKNRKFSLTGSLPYPIMIKLGSEKNGYLSGSFTISPGEQKIIINIDSARVIPEIDNVVMEEYYNQYSSFFQHSRAYADEVFARANKLRNLSSNSVPDSIRQQIDLEIKKTYAKNDSTLLAYVRNHPNSYLALWKLVELSNFGYEPIFEPIYNSFLDEIKNTHTGRVLKEKISLAKSTIALGLVFPQIAYVDRKNNHFSDIKFLHNKYTFVDFWYSNCGPCLAQFDGLKKVYNDYKSKGLEIVGISTDKIKYKAAWEKVIATRKLNWLQYWDKNGEEADRLNIKAFPTSFLMDNKGIIVAKNLSYSELRKFLEDNM